MFKALNKVDLGSVNRFKDYKQYHFLNLSRFKCEHSASVRIYSALVQYNVWGGGSNKRLNWILLRKLLSGFSAVNKEFKKFKTTQTERVNCWSEKVSPCHYNIPVRWIRCAVYVSNTYLQPRGYVADCCSVVTYIVEQEGYIPPNRSTL